MALTRQQHGVAALGVLEHRPDRLAAVDDHLEVFAHPPPGRFRTGREGGTDVLSALLAGIVAGDDKVVGEPRHRLTHQGTLARVAITWRAKQRQQPSWRQRA